VGPSRPHRGGIAQFNDRLAAEIASRGDEPLQVGFKRLYPSFLFPGTSQFEAGPASSNALPILDSLNPLTWHSAGRFIADWHPESVVCHWWHPFFAPAYRGLMSRLPRSTVRIAICHNVLPHESGSLQSLTARFGLGGMDGFIVHSSHDVDALAGLLGQGRIRDRAAEAFHPLYDQFPGADLPKSEARQRLDIDPDDRIVLCFGLIRPYKGVDVLLEAARRLTDLPRLKLLIVGEVYSGRDNLMEMIKLLPMTMVRFEDRFVGDDEVAPYFRAADLVVLPYRAATQSGIVPIAYHCRRPVLATLVGGLPDIIDEGRSGFLVEPGRPDLLADSIRRFFLELNAPLLKEGIEAVAARLSWSRYLDILKELTRNLRAIGYA